jgi:TP901 family phage tail tape measure protein
MAGTKPIVINIQGDDSNLRKVLKGAAGRVDGFAKKIGKLGAKAGVAFAATAGAVSVTGIKAFGEFEKGMQEVFTLLPKAGKETFDQLEKDVKSFSKEFGVLPEKTIPALYQALSAGVPKENVFEFLEVAQKAAKGGVTDLTTAVDGISSVLNVYGSDNISAARASDLMFTAVKLGKTTMDEISKSMFQMAPIAGSVGVEFENLTASVAVLTAKGVPTAVASTQMKGALAELAKAGSKADVAFRDLVGKGFQQFLKEGGTFSDAIVKMKKGADNAGISVLDMFGSVEAGQAILALTSDGGAAFNDVMAQMQDSAGATDAAFETMNKGFSADMEKIKANLKVLAIEIGAKLAPIVAKMSKFILDGFQKLGPVLERVKDRIVELAGDVRERALPILRRLRDIFVIVAEKAMLVWSTVYEYLAPGIKDLADKVTDLAERAFGKLKEIFDAIPWTAVWESIVEWSEKARAAVMNFVRDIPNKFRDALAWIEKNKDMLIVLGGAIGGLVAGGLAAWGLYIVKLKLVALKTSLLTIKTKLLNSVIMKNPWMILVAAVVAAIGALIAAYYRFERVREIVDSVTNYFRNRFIPQVLEVRDKVVEVFTTIKDYLERVFWPAVKVIVDVVVDVFHYMKKQIKLVVDLVRAIFDGDWKEATKIFVELVKNAVTFIVDFFIKLPGRLFKALGPIILALLDIAKAFTTYLLKKVARVMDSIVDFFIALPGNLLRAGIDIASALIEMGLNWGRSIIDAIVEGLRRAGGAISGYIMSLVPDVGSIVDSIVGGAKNKAKGVLKGVGGIFGFADGGIVTKPTLGLVGEAGPEAIVPLSKAGQIGGTVININVSAGVGDPVAIGDGVVEVLTAWQRANGTIPIDTSAA